MKCSIVYQNGIDQCAEEEHWSSLKLLRINIGDDHKEVYEDADIGIIYEI
jgi:hypothetical protein